MKVTNWLGKMTSREGRGETFETYTLLQESPWKSRVTLLNMTSPSLIYRRGSWCRFMNSTWRSTQRSSSSFLTRSGPPDPVPSFSFMQMKGADTIQFGRYTSIWEPQIVLCKYVSFELLILPWLNCNCETSQPALQSQICCQYSKSSSIGSFSDEILIQFWVIGLSKEFQYYVVKIQL